MPDFKKRTHKQKGFTLVELMVVVVIFMFILAGVYTAFLSQHHASVVQARVSETQQNARIAMDFLSKEIRMANFGKPLGSVNTFSNGITPAINNDATSGNNVLNGTDQITVITGYRQISTLASAANTDATSITLVANGDQFNTTTKKYVCIDGIGRIDNYEVTGIAGNVLTVSPALHRGYQADAPVLLVKAITYSVNDAGFLTRNENTGGGAQPLVPNIEDLQFAYQLNDGTWSNAPGVPDDIRAVRINVLARTRFEDHRPGQAGTIGTKPDIEDHDVDNVTRDGFRRRLLTSVVEIRNLGF
ncbi:MAG: prepilin-type N-terminal cleavage/methylation domain-containing protein [Thermodesulfobacteriota bacterium]|jgi:prepilin-type N-terminal cleavage/methylation domain-containing protein|nr:MAG: prepilin-type N-terminal cleavage/methylation domain-containing protein [Thermodesulfobacteriota bacterium]